MTLVKTYAGLNPVPVIKTGSPAVDAVVAAKAANADQPVGSYVDTVTFSPIGHNQRVVDGVDYAMWLLAAKGAGHGAVIGGYPGIYKWTDNGWQWQGYGSMRIGVKDGTYKNRVISRTDSEPVVYTLEGPPIQTLFNPDKPMEKLPLPSVGGGALFTNDILKNSGITGAGIPSEYGTMLPEVEITATPLTAFGLDIKPIYLIGGIVALVIGYFLFKKYA